MDMFYERTMINVFLCRLRQPDKAWKPRKAWKEVADKEMNNLHIKANDATDCSKCRVMIREN